MLFVPSSQDLPSHTNQETSSQATDPNADHQEDQNNQADPPLPPSSQPLPQAYTSWFPSVPSSQPSPSPFYWPPVSPAIHTPSSTPVPQTYLDKLIASSSQIPFSFPPRMGTPGYPPMPPPRPVDSYRPPPGQPFHMPPPSEPRAPSRASISSRRPGPSNQAKTAEEIMMAEAEQRMQPSTGEKILAALESITGQVSILTSSVQDLKAGNQTLRKDYITLRDRLHDVQIGQRTLATKQNIIDEISEQLSTALQEMDRTSLDQLHHKVSSLPDTIAKTLLPRVERIVDRIQLSNKENRAPDHEDPSIQLINVLIGKLDSVQSLNDTLRHVPIANLQQAVRDVAVFKQSMDALQAKVTQLPDLLQDSLSQSAPDKSQPNTSHQGGIIGAANDSELLSAVTRLESVLASKYKMIAQEGEVRQVSLRGWNEMVRVVQDLGSSITKFNANVNDIATNGYPGGFGDFGGFGGFGGFDDLLRPPVRQGQRHTRPTSRPEDDVFGINAILGIPPASHSSREHPKANTRTPPSAVRPSHSSQSLLGGLPTPNTTTVSPTNTQVTESLSSNDHGGIDHYGDDIPTPPMRPLQTNSPNSAVGSAHANEHRDMSQPASQPKHIIDLTESPVAQDLMAAENGLKPSNTQSNATSRPKTNRKRDSARAKQAAPPPNLTASQEQYTDPPAARTRTKTGVRRRQTLITLSPPPGQPIFKFDSSPEKSDESQPSTRRPPPGSRGHTSSAPATRSHKAKGKRKRSDNGESDNANNQSEESEIPDFTHSSGSTSSDDPAGSNYSSEARERARREEKNARRRAAREKERACREERRARDKLRWSQRKARGGSNKTGGQSAETSITILNVDSQKTASGAGTQGMGDSSTAPRPKKRARTTAAAQKLPDVNSVDNEATQLNPQSSQAGTKGGSSTTGTGETLSSDAVAEQTVNNIISSSNTTVASTRPRRTRNGDDSSPNPQSQEQVGAQGASPQGPSGIHQAQTRSSPRAKTWVNEPDRQRLEHPVSNERTSIPSSPSQGQEQQGSSQSQPSLPLRRSARVSRLNGVTDQAVVDNNTSQEASGPVVKSSQTTKPSMPSWSRTPNQSQTQDPNSTSQHTANSACGQGNFSTSTNTTTHSQAEQTPPLTARIAQSGFGSSSSFFDGVLARHAAGSDDDVVILPSRPQVKATTTSQKTKSTTANTSSPKRSSATTPTKHVNTIKSHFPTVRTYSSESLKTSSEATRSTPVTTVYSRTKISYTANDPHIETSPTAGINSHPATTHSESLSTSAVGPQATPTKTVYSRSKNLTASTIAQHSTVPRPPQSGFRFGATYPSVTRQVPPGGTRPSDELLQPFQSSSSITLSRSAPPAQPTSRTPKWSTSPESSTARSSVVYGMSRPTPGAGPSSQSKWMI